MWERALAPIGLALLAKVVRHARDHGALPAYSQDPRYATKAPMIHKPVLLSDEGPTPVVSLVATVAGPDRPGIISLLADRAQRHGANWTSSQMTSLGGEFAGMIQFDVPPANAQALAAALQGLEATGLRVLVARSEGDAAAAARRGIHLELVGDDRPGIVSQLTAILAERGISIETLHTEVAPAAASGKATFKIDAHLQVPGSLSVDALRQQLGALAGEMMVDIALGERPGEAARS